MIKRILKNKRLASILCLFIVLTVALFIFINYFVPDFIIERHGENENLFYAKTFFISVCGALIISIFNAVVLFKKKLAPYIATFKRFTPLLKMTVDRDYKKRYKRSVLGVAWSLISPLMTLLIMTMVFSLLFSRNIANFPIYLFSGTLIFGFFSEATNAAMNSIESNRAIINKVYVPKYIFPLTKVFLALVHLGFSLLAFAVVFLVTRAPFHWTILFLPVPLLYAFVFVLGLSMLVSCIAVFFKDFAYIYGIFLTGLQYLTPIFYPVEILPDKVRTFIGLNPLYHYITYVRSLVLDGVFPGLWANVVCISFSLFFLFLGTIAFMANQDRYILYI